MNCIIHLVISEECTRAIKGKVHPKTEFSPMLFFWHLNQSFWTWRKLTWEPETREARHEVVTMVMKPQLNPSISLTFKGDITWEFFFRLKFCSNYVATKVIHFSKLMEEMVWGEILLCIAGSETQKLCCALKNAPSFIFPLTLWATQYCDFNKTAFVESPDLD